MNKTSLRCTFRSSGYSEAEINRLESDLAEFVVLQSRRQGMPEAGGSFEITFVLQCVGELVLTGVAWDLIKFTGLKLFEFYRRKQEETGGEPPEIDILEFRFDNVDLRLRGGNLEFGEECNFLSESTLEHLPEIIESIVDHLNSEPLVSTDIQVIDVYEPQIVVDAGGILNLQFPYPWKLAGVDVMSPQAYNPSTMILSGE